MANFWEDKSLSEMTEEEWESLCDRCGECCLHKMLNEDFTELSYTAVACNQLDNKTLSCKDYLNRVEKCEVECIKLTNENLEKCYWLPDSCAYSLLLQGKPLPEWHPLITGSQDTMLEHKSNQPWYKHITYNVDVADWEDYVYAKVKLKSTSEKK